MKWVGQSLVRQPSDFSYNPVDGYTFLFKHQGNLSAVSALSKQYRLSRTPFVVRFDGSVATIESNQQLPEGGFVETPNGSWGLFGMDETTDWRQHVKFLALTEYERGFISDKINGVTNFTPTEAATMQMAGTALEFYTMAFNGQQHFTRTNYVLRHNQTVSQSYQARLSGSNINRVYTKTALLNEAAQFDEDSLPQMLISEINAIGDPDVTVPATHTYGWLKKTPSIQTVAGGRVECSVEYVLEIWPLLFYPLAA